VNVQWTKKWYHIGYYYVQWNAKKGFLPQESRLGYVCCCK